MYYPSIVNDQPKHCFIRLQYQPNYHICLCFQTTLYAILLQLQLLWISGGLFWLMAILLSALFRYTILATTYIAWYSMFFPCPLHMLYMCCTCILHGGHGGFCALLLIFIFYYLLVLKCGMFVLVIIQTLMRLCYCGTPLLSLDRPQCACSGHVLWGWCPCAPCGCMGQTLA